MQGLLALYTASPLEYAACMYRRRSTDGIVGMFADIAGRYDLMNTLMSFGMDKRWRKRVVRLARLFPGAAMLDVGAGTG
ncbi:MAG TPA: class I SAM-dependent methyltransferase, partial [Deltaproteobacteria bacterium]|nr:class I SAM-dependent methyltransferase [Deltaproteobacteria bacterium]